MIESPNLLFTISELPKTPLTDRAFRIAWDHVTQRTWPRWTTKNLNEDYDAWMRATTVPDTEATEKKLKNLSNRHKLPLHPDPAYAKFQSPKRNGPSAGA